MDESFSFHGHDAHHNKSRRRPKRRNESGDSSCHSPGPVRQYLVYNVLPRNQEPIPNMVRLRGARLYGTLNGDVASRVARKLLPLSLLFEVKALCHVLGRAARFQHLLWLLLLPLDRSERGSRLYYGGKHLGYEPIPRDALALDALCLLRGVTDTMRWPCPWRRGNRCRLLRGITDTMRWPCPWRRGNRCKRGYFLYNLYFSLSYFWRNYVHSIHCHNILYDPRVARGRRSRAAFHVRRLVGCKRLEHKVFIFHREPQKTGGVVFVG